MAEGDWLVKYRYGPNYEYESVLGTYRTYNARERARDDARALNLYYQTDEYFTEAWDAAKAGQ